MGLKGDGKLSNRYIVFVRAGTNYQIAKYISVNSYLYVDILKSVDWLILNPSRTKQANDICIYIYIYIYDVPIYSVRKETEQIDVKSPSSHMPFVHGKILLQTSKRISYSVAYDYIW